jgi:tetratricopeptide (TPR) repeat protein
MPLMVNATLGYLGHAYGRAGRFEEAKAVLETALAQSTAMNFVCWHSLTTVFLADAVLRAGQRPDAERIARQAVALVRRRAHRGHEAHALRLLADTLVLGDLRGRPDAEATYREALALAGRLDMRPLAAHCHLGLGTLHRRTGDEANAKAELATAATIFRELNMRGDVAQAEAAHDEVGSQAAR